MKLLKINDPSYSFEQELKEFKNEALAYAENTKSRVEYFTGVMSLKTFTSLSVHPSMYKFFCDVVRYNCSQFIKIEPHVTFQYSGITFVVSENYAGDFIELTASNGFRKVVSPVSEQVDARTETITLLKSLIKKLESGQ